MRMSFCKWIALVAVGLIACQSEEARIAAHSERAEAYFAAEKWPEAKIEYMNLIQLDPTNARAHFNLAETHLRLAQVEQGSPADALMLLREAVRLAPDNAEYRVRLGVLELAAQDPEAAAEHARVLLEREPDNVDALLMRAQAKALGDDVEGQIQDLERAAELAPERAAIPLLLGQAQLRRGDFEASEKALRRMLELDRTTRAYVYWAAFLMERNRGDEAIAAMTTALELATTDEERLQARTRLANLYVTSGRLDDAERVMQEALAADPDSSELLAQLARFYVYRGQVPKAEEMLRQQVERKPSEATAYLTLALFYESLERPSDALATLDRALAVAPEDERVLTLRAQYLLAAKPDDPAAREEARGLLDQVLAKNPNSVVGLFTEAKFLLGDGRAEDAAKRLEQVVQAQPSANAHYLLATAYTGMRRDDLARTQLLEALALDATSPRIHADLAALYLRTGEAELAAREAELALETQAGNPRLLLIAAEALLRSGQKQAALQRLATLEIEKLPSSLRISAADMYRRLEQRDRARQILEKALEESPRDPGALRAWITLEAPSDPGRVLARLDAAIAADPKNALLHGLRGSVRTAQIAKGGADAPAEAERDFATALELDPNAIEPQLGLAQLYRAQGRTAEALERYAAARARLPDNLEIQLEEASFREALGQAEQAQTLYEQVLERDPSNVLAKNNLAWVLANRPGVSPAQLDRALRLAQEAKDAQPNVAAFADTLGYVLLKKDRPVPAIGLFKEALAAFAAGPERAGVRVHLGQAYEREGDLDAARQQFRVAGEESAASAAELGSFLERLSRRDEAAKAYRDAIARYPNEAIEAYAGLAELHRTGGEAERAIEIYEGLLAKRPELGRAQAGLARALVDLASPTPQQLDRALELAERSRSQQPESPEAAGALGRVLYRRQDYAKAAELFEQAVARDSAGPRRAQSLYDLALTYEALGDLPRAREHVEKSLADAADFPAREQALRLQEKLAG